MPHFHSLGVGGLILIILIEFCKHLQDQASHGRWFLEEDDDGIRNALRYFKVQMHIILANPLGTSWDELCKALSRDAPKSPVFGRLIFQPFTHSFC